ncbi:hypothetical protein FHR75_002573 [Kineococcus radiotolerans]|uniref:Uncharacterized protein n=1 Tax=Kineococcus radiotolerans TaxID=131568 RepID=A0A7W4XXA5_KINRA|nr:hypothetical protein [Kineococcus radiotolerans]MBB2901758.1 hypothetical protein [Kineococcus radiotolerans]
MMHALVAQAAQQTEEAHGQLPMPPVAFGIVALCVLAMMLIATMAFRSVGTRH